MSETTTTSRRRFNPIAVIALCAVLAAALSLAACGGSGSGGSGLSGAINIDGSSTVGPLTKAVAEQFNAENPDVQITVGEAGTGGGFERFCAGEIEINDASRSIEPEEATSCEDNKIAYQEIQVANDALTVVVNPDNSTDCVTIDQLAQIWGPDGTAADWNEVDGLDFSAPIERYGPGTDSGTFDYFTAAVNGEEGVQTKDFNDVGENDNQTVTGVEGSVGGIGYFGYSYFEANSGELKALQVDGGNGCVAPSVASVQDGTYTPLSRGLFLYPSKQALGDEATRAFIDFYIQNANEIGAQIGFIGLTDEQVATASKQLAAND